MPKSRKSVGRRNPEQRIVLQQNLAKAREVLTAKRAATAQAEAERAVAQRDEVWIDAVTSALIPEAPDVSARTVVRIFRRLRTAGVT